MLRCRINRGIEHALDLIRLIHNRQAMERSADLSREFTNSCAIDWDRAVDRVPDRASRSASRVERHCCGVLASSGPAFSGSRSSELEFKEAQCVVRVAGHRLGMGPLKSARR